MDAKEKKAQRARKYYMANRNKIIAKSAAYQKANTETVNAKNRRWTHVNNARHKATRAIWRSLNRDKIKEWRRKNADRINGIRRKKMKELMAGNHDKHKALALKYYHQNKHRSHIKLYRKIWAKTHRDQINRAGYRWRKRNPEQVKIFCQNRRAKMLNNGGKLSRNLFSRLMMLQQGRCICCKVNLKAVKVHMDHIMPIARGGEHNDSNIQLLCAKCNLRKQAKDPIVFMQEQGFLL